MSFVRRFYRKPQQLWLRRALFQVHLWLGVIIALYLIAVGVTGSILVFKSEAVNAMLPRSSRQHNQAISAADIDQVVTNFRAKFPRDTIVLVYLPTKSVPEFQAIASREKPEWGKVMMTADYETGEVVGDVHLTNSWLGFVHALHINLLAGPIGFVANGVGAILLIVVSLSGLVLWWPGINSWRRAFTVNFKTNWKRINWDLHNTVGFYTLLLVLFWSVSTVYFVWEDKFTAMVEKFSHVTLAERKIPVIKPSQNQSLTSHKDIKNFMVRAQEQMPNLKPIAVLLPRSKTSPIGIYLAQGGEDVDSSDAPDGEAVVFFNPYDGNQLAAHPRATNHTVGDWVIWSMIPLHFGTQWGFAVKVLWAILGLSIPALTITGLLMYWNRYLSKKWRQINQNSAQSNSLEVAGGSL